jgi:hypothetical protein
MVFCIRRRRSAVGVPPLAWRSASKRPSAASTEAAFNAGDVSEQFLAERGQRALPELAGGFAFLDEHPFLRGDGARIHPVGEVVDGAAGDRIAFLDGPFDRGDAAMPGQQ